MATLPPTNMEVQKTIFQRNVHQLTWKRRKALLKQVVFLQGSAHQPMLAGGRLTLHQSWPENHLARIARVWTSIWASQSRRCTAHTQIHTEKASNQPGTCHEAPGPETRDADLDGGMDGQTDRRIDMDRYG